MEDCILFYWRKSEQNVPQMYRIFICARMTINLNFSLLPPPHTDFNYNTDGYDGDGAEDGKSQDSSETLPYIDESPTMSPQLCVSQGPDGEAVSPSPLEVRRGTQMHITREGKTFWLGKTIHTPWGLLRFHTLWTYRSLRDTWWWQNHALGILSSSFFYLKLGICVCQSHKVLMKYTESCGTKCKKWKG